MVGAATSVSEWTTDHSLMLVATRIKRSDEGMVGGLIKCLGAHPEDLYCGEAGTWTLSCVWFDESGVPTIKVALTLVAEPPAFDTTTE